jgi:beta-galactosidase
MQNQWEVLNTDPGSIQIINPAETWKRKLFSGLAQVIVQSSKQAGEITLTATSPGLKSASVILNSLPCILKPEAENVEK